MGERKGWDFCAQSYSVCRKRELYARSSSKSVQASKLRDILQVRLDREKEALPRNGTQREGQRVREERERE